MAVAAPRRTHVVPSVALAVLAGVAPLLTLVWLSRHRALARSERMLETAVDATIARVDRLFGDAQAALTQLASETGGVFDERTTDLLQRAVYNLRSFRESGLIDAEARLVCTSLGPVDPPVLIVPAKRSTPALQRMQIVGLVDTEVMRQRSLILGLPTTGQGEVNLLLDPAVLTEVFETAPLGPGGTAVVIDDADRVLAAFGLDQSAVVQDDEAAARLQVKRRSERFGVRIAATIDRDWALRDWYADLNWLIPLGLACSALLALLTMRLASRPASMHDDLRLALRRGEFEAHYQPTIDLATGRCIGAEALLRWRHPVDGMVRPDVFIAVAEESGLIEPLTEWLLDRVAKDLGETLRERGDLHIGVNLASGHFNSPSIVATLTRILKPYQLSPDRLMLEATERGMIGEDIGLSRSVMDELRALGAKIAIDDFGAGYSSLAYLHTFKFDVLKIDASFVRRIGTGALSAATIDAIIELGHTLNARIIAEGVEMPQQADFLRARGVHAAQGWLYSRAVPVAEFLEFLRRHS